jgi:catechol 2,3-dioxygenase
MDNLGFKMREYIDMGDNNIFAGWLSVTPLVHDIAEIGQPDAETPARLHHLAYRFDNAQDIFKVCRYIV